MRSSRITTRIGAFVAATALATGGALALTGAVASAAATPSDQRAVFHSGNAVNCGQVGFPNDTLAFANGTDSINDGNVAGQVLDNTAGNGGTVDVGHGSLANVQNLQDVTIDAIVLKGGPAYNVYLGPNEVPPTLGGNQHYIPPFNPGGHIPTMSHWFICYSEGEVQPSTGTLAVTKVIVPPNGTPVTPLPTSFDVNVSCTDETNVNLTLSVTDDPADLTGVVTGIEDGATCTVTETTAPITGQTVAYSPANGDDSAAVIDVVGGGQVQTTVTNDFGGVDVLPETVTQAPTPVQVAPAFTG